MLEIDRMLTLTTGHVSQLTAKQLEAYLEAMDTQCHDDIVPNFDGLSIYAKADYGWFIYIGDARDSVEKFQQLPADLQNVVEFALDQDCVWLCLDRDGDGTDGLPLFDW